MRQYRHKVQYYETDRMGITHHSNHIRWMEEARVRLLEDIGWSFDKIEELGIVSPVASVTCDYKGTTTFYDDVDIKVWIKEYRGVKIVFGYEMTNAKTGRLVATASSVHCFMDRDGKFVHIRRAVPGLDAERDG